MAAFHRDPKSDPRLQEIVSRLVESTMPEEIILFGSRARREGREGSDEVSPVNPNRRGPSDADFLVIMPRGTSKDIINALLVRVPQLNAGLPIEMELHPRAGDALCEELRVGLPRISTCAMKEGILFYPPNRTHSVYREYADAWRLANHIRLWFYPAKADLESAKAQIDAGFLDGAAHITPAVVNGALHALLIAVGGDIPRSDDPADIVEQIAKIDPAIGAGLVGCLEEFKELADAGHPVDPETVLRSVALAELVVQYVDKLAEPMLAPTVPCPA